MTALTWHCTLFGVPTLRSSEHTQILERKTAALLAYLAQEGPTSRSHLIGLLWPDTREAAARNNLVHLLRKLKTLTGTELVTGQEVLSLAAELRTDVEGCREMFTKGDFARFNNAMGEFLSSLVYDDCPDLEDWIAAEREQWNEWRSQALLADANQLEQSGEYLEAVARIRELLTLDPLNEEGHRRLMRLQYLLGNRHHALETFRKLTTLLREELDVEPLPETLELARWIERATLPIPAQPRNRPGLPLTVLRPPALVGREREWALMEKAWEKGQIIFLRGEPGVGKSRLARDFAASRGSYLVLEARPGDMQTPYASSARNVRTILAQNPDLQLEPWIRQELSRILPELSGPTPPPPLNGQEDVLRFNEAVRQTVIAGGANLACCVLDDWQYYDELSNQQGGYMISASFPLEKSGFPRFIECFRKDELSPEAEEMLIKHLVEPGLAVLIDVNPLPADETLKLLADLGVTVHPGMRERLSQYSGGNPLFLLETVRHLLESNQLAEDSELTMPEKVGQIIEKRLQRLSNPALQAARAAAVLQTDFDLELVAELLNAPLLDFIGTWDELEAAQVVKDGKFSHDLIFETVVRATPKAIQQLLHRSAARVLTQRGAPVARVARHYQQGGDFKQAAPLYLQAARNAQQSFGVKESTRYYLLAAECFQEAGKPREAFRALVDRAVAFGHLNERAPREEALKMLFDHAHTPMEKALAHFEQAEYHSTYHEGPETEAAARKAIEIIQHEPKITIEEQTLWANLHASVAVALWIQQQIPEATEAMRRAVDALEPLGESTSLAANYSNLAVMLDHNDRHNEAIQYHIRACAIHEKLGDLPPLATTLHNLAVSYSEQGRMQESLEMVLRARHLEQQADDEHRGLALGFAATGQAYYELGNFGLCLENYNRAIENALEDTWHRGMFDGLKGELYMQIGAYDLAHDHLKISAEYPRIPPQYRSRTLINLGTLHHLQGLNPNPFFEEASELLSSSPRMISRARLWIAKADTVVPEEALELGQKVLALALEKDLGGTEISGRTRVAQAHFRMGNHAEALEQIEKACSWLTNFEPARLARGEVLYTRWRIREALGHPGTREAWQAVSDWLQMVLRNLPEPFHANFKARNPVAKGFYQHAEHV
ncbi:tetratricopeptide repeat protein [Deinococcus cellulosilyticus]|uniref:Bacterial transcriptional activator domain-containing protein n=1 Tax=Deinococcus cellulosilyticus (strain DSM 18568 / NBRC 106333 / KACC 11606 / 5516J-15) TaxID=1223518 RepID=A0A511MZQ0_DEIC1|nr:tetratricopeptide repeat protein [Deinococcus cellulosilyticus]GEM46105.1 hypothetical protein DC3_17400 [Deinococcus cellulosilyticus NBRC 106333 = KACC 11606]